MNETDDLQTIKQAVANYSSQKGASRLPYARELLTALVAIREQVKEAGREDKGIEQRIARDLSDILSEVPVFAHLLADKKAISRIHNRQGAEEHFEKIQVHLEAAIKDFEEENNRQIKKWVKNHPVLGELRKVINKDKGLPKDAYILLFRKGEDDLPELITRESEEGDRVFARMRSAEFRDDFKLYQQWHDAEQVLLGAAVVVDGKLHAAIGVLPEAGEDKDQLQVINSLSRQATDRPAMEFLAANPVLEGLHALCRRKKLPKDSYILLFTPSAEDPEKVEIVTKPGAEGKVLTRFYGIDFAMARKIFDTYSCGVTICGAAVINGSELLHSWGKLPPTESEEDEPVSPLLRLSRSAVEKPTAEFLETNEILNSLHQLANDPEFKHKDAQVIMFVELDGKLTPIPPPRGAKPGHRWHVNDFKIPKLVRDTFGAAPQIIGASVIGEKEAFVPKHGGKGQAQGGVAGAFGTSGSSGGFGGGGGGGFGGGGGDRGGSGGDRGRGGRGGRDDKAPVKSVVLAHFGRTPLKKDLVATPEMFQRLGIVFPPAPPPEHRDDRDRDRDRNRKGKPDRKGDRNKDRNKDRNGQGAGREQVQGAGSEQGQGTDQEPNQAGESDPTKDAGQQQGKRGNRNRNRNRNRDRHGDQNREAQPTPDQQTEENVALDQTPDLNNAVAQEIDRSQVQQAESNQPQDVESNQVQEADRVSADQTVTIIEEPQTADRSEEHEHQSVGSEN